MPGTLESNGFVICHAGAQPGGNAIVICHGGYRHRPGTHSTGKAIGEDFTPAPRAIGTRTKVPTRAGNVRFYPVHGFAGVVSPDKVKRMVLAGDVIQAYESAPAETQTNPAWVVNYRLYYDAPYKVIAKAWPGGLDNANTVPNHDLITIKHRSAYRHLSTLFFALKRHEITYTNMHMLFCRVPIDPHERKAIEIGLPVQLG